MVSLFVFSLVSNNDKDDDIRSIEKKRYPLSPYHKISWTRSQEIGCYDDQITLKFDMHIGSTAALVPVKFQSDWNYLNPNLAASRLH